MNVCEVILAKKFVVFVIVFSFHFVRSRNDKSEVLSYLALDVKCEIAIVHQQKIYRKVCVCA